MAKNPNDKRNKALVLIRQKIKSLEESLLTEYSEDSHIKLTRLYANEAAVEQKLGIETKALKI